MFLFILVVSFESRAQSSEELFKKVFGTKEESKLMVLDATTSEYLLGEVRAQVSGEKLLSLSGADLEKIIKHKIRDEKKTLYSFGDIQIAPAALPFKVVYSPTDLRITIDIPAGDLAAQDANLFDELIPFYASKSVDAAPFSFGTNYKLESVQNKNLNQKDFFQANVDSFMNIKTISLENQMNYLSSRSNEWYRQNSRLVYDRSNKMQRAELGDVNFPVLGYQQSRSIGGLSIYRDFSLNPYRSNGPTSSFEYEITTRSLVRTYINGVILKTEYMNPGRYSVKDIPLNNGVNKIIVEITDEFGKKNVLIFNEAGSVDLLAAGMSKYSMAAGYPSTDNDVAKKYEEANGAFFSAFYQYGVARSWSSGAYTQGNKNFNLVGIDNIFATNYGNWVMDAGASKNKSHSGPAAHLTYQLNLFGAAWYDTHTLTTRVEYRSPWFNESGENIRNRYDFISSTNYSVPLLEKINVAVGGNYQNPRAGEISKYGLNSSLTSKVFDMGSLTFYYARTRDESRLWSTQLYFFLNFSFGDSGTMGSAFYEKNSETKRVNLIHDDGKKLNSLKVSSSLNDNTTTSDASLDLQYNTTLADVGVRDEFIKVKGNKIGNKISFRFLSAFAYVHNGSDSAFSISRPISNSFVIFKPNDGWKGQRFGVQSSGNTDTESGLFGESLLSGLSPYQYRRLQLDPSLLEPGYILGQESFVVYPRFRSGHLFNVGKSGFLVIRGTIVDKNKKPQPLKVGYWMTDSGQTIPFFTGREGEFFIEGVEPSIGKIQIDSEEFESVKIDLKKSKSGLIDIGSVELPYKESHL